MKVAILVPLFPPKWLAGTEIATYNIARHLAKRSHNVHVITLLDEDLSQETIEEGFHIHRISRQKLRFLGVVLLWAKIFWLLRKINPDIVHAQSIEAGIPGVLAKKTLKKTYVVWGRGSEIYFPWRFKGLISRLVLGNADAAIALTEDMKREMRKICNRDIIVIPNGINLRNFESLSREEARNSLQIEEDKKVILFVGKLHPIKGVKYLIQAMGIIGQKETNARLLLVGDGEERDDLRGMGEKLNLGKDITFVGKVSNEEVPEYMTASDVFVLPSLSEGFPNVILEAMASGLPIVATRVGGLPEIIKEGDNGFLVEPRNPQQIAEKVLLLLEDDELRERISRNNKEKAKEYSWKSIVERLEEVYSACLNVKTRSKE